MEKRIKDILTDEEFAEIHKLNKEIMNASTKMEIRYYKYEIDQIIKRAKERYFRFFDVVEKHVNQWDLMDLLYLGAPDDEYSDEIRRIAETLPKIMDEQDLAKNIKNVMDHSFDACFSEDRCLYFAENIWREFQSK